DQPLAERLRERIVREGALTFRDWMAAALYDEREGYYRRAEIDRWGRAGDYRTSPERTPLFAATFARHFAALHEILGSPARWTIREAGAGAGDFASVALDTLRREHPRVFDATRYVIDEIGESSRESIAARLSPFADRVEFRGNGERDAQPCEGVVFSNELIDALPVHRVRVRGGRLRELCVGLDGAGNFSWEEREPSTPRLAQHFARLGVSLSEGQSAEVNLEAEEWIAASASRISRGYVVTVDYGANARELYDGEARPEGTLRAFRSHRFCEDLLASPGAQDITSTVNWTQLERAGRDAGLETVSLERLDRFLMRAGALEQLESLAARAAGEGERAWLLVSAREMILPAGMGESFQVLVQKK
ncbi:MAG: SAM-dependent methyltransferase, partial [Acidobacteria bacterium]|nr:SAM-dependent methyltransferase [Acidobacteriota bacterium]